MWICAGPIAIIASVLLGVGFATAQVVPYDPPTLSVADLGLYRITLGVTAGPSGAPSGFTIHWMKRADYDALGGWPTLGHPNLHYCEFYGAPTLNLWGGSPILHPNQTAYVQPGDLFDETSIVTDYSNELESGTEYVLRGYVRGDGNGDPSDYSSTVFTSTQSGGCSQAFWKAHPGLWPASCLPMCLGTKCDYTQVELLAIYYTPAFGNGLISLAHQLITAKLNICNGSDPAPLASTISGADALIDGLIVPPVGAGSLDPSLTSDFTEVQDDYNNGLLGGLVDCPTVVSVIGPDAPFELGIVSLSPNPAHEGTSVVFSAPRSGPLRVEIFDLQGRTVTTLVDGVRPAGRHEAAWNGSRDGARAPAGLYFVIVRTAMERAVRRLVLVR